MIVDTSAIVAIALGEPERGRLIRLQVRLGSISANAFRTQPPASPESLFFMSATISRAPILRRSETATAE
jgi:uncharacterized protein with PIN domain